MKDSHLAVAAQAGAAPDGEPSEAEPSEAEPSEAKPSEAEAAAKDERMPLRSGTKNERRAAVAELMRVHGDAVFGLCLRLVRSRALADDVVQQVFLEAYRDLDRFERRSSPRAWLFGIAIHRCQDALKTQKRRLQLIENDEPAMLDVEDPGQGPLERVGRTQLVAALEDCLKQLSPSVRTTVLMRFQTGATYEELAGLLAATSDSLQMRVARALRGLRQCLENKGWSGE